MLSASALRLSASSSLFRLGASASSASQSFFFASSLLASSARFASSTASKKSRGKKPAEKERSKSASKKSVSEPAGKSDAAKSPETAAVPSTSSSAASDVAAAAVAAAATSTSLSGATGGTVSATDSARDDLSTDLEVEAVRWDVPEVTDRTVDEKGQYIVSKVPWTKRGEVAYTTPPPPGPMEARFGYQIVVVKRPQSYWQWYRTQINFFSWGHLMYQVTFALAVAWVISWVQLETVKNFEEMRRPGNLAGDQLGKGDANRHQIKITVSEEERQEVMNAMQMAYMDGKDMASYATKDYQMKKIKRPTELRAEDFLRGGKELTLESSSRSH